MGREMYLEGQYFEDSDIEIGREASKAIITVICSKSEDKRDPGT